MGIDDYEAGLRGQSAGADTFSANYQAGARERERREKNDSGGGFGAGGGNIAFAAIATIVAFIAFVISFCTYPVAGITTLITFLVGASYFNSGAGMSAVGLVFAMMVPCYLFYRLLFRLELAIASFRVYRIFRQYWRMAVGSFAVHVIGTAFHMPDQYPNGAPLWGYLIDGAMTTASVFLLYLNSIRLDEKYELDPVRFRWMDFIIVSIKRIFVHVPGPTTRSVKGKLVCAACGSTLFGKVSRCFKCGAQLG